MIVQMRLNSHNIYCKECSDPKPGKNGTKRCYNCQPWWQGLSEVTCCEKSCISTCLDCRCDYTEEEEEEEEQDD